MRTMLLIVSLVMGMLAWGCAPAKHTVVKLDSNSSPPTEGVAYVLPKNLLNVKIEYELTKKTMLGESKAALFAEKTVIDAMKNLGFDVSDYEKIAKLPTQKISVKKVELSLVAVPDNTQWYSIKLPRGRTVDAQVTATLNSLGVLSTVDAKAADKKLQIGVQIVKTIASVAGAFFGTNAKKATREVDKTIDNCTTLAAGISETYLQNAATRLCYARNELLTLYSKEYKLANTETLKYQETKLKAYIGELEEAISPLVTKGFTVEFNVEPEGFTKQSDSSELLFSINSTNEISNQTQCLEIHNAAAMGQVEWKKGLCSGDPSTPNSTAKYELTVMADSPWPFTGKSVEVPQSLGYRYRIPRHATMLVKEEADGKSKVLVSKRAQIAQLGVVAALPEQFGSSKTNIAVDLYEESGAIKKVSATTEATMLEQTKAVGEAFSSVGDAITAIRASNSETARLQLEVEALKLEKEKLELQEEIRSMLLPKTE